MDTGSRAAMVVLGGFSIGATLNIYRWIAVLALTGIACPAFACAFEILRSDRG